MANQTQAASSAKEPEKPPVAAVATDPTEDEFDPAMKAWTDAFGPQDKQIRSVHQVNNGALHIVNPPPNKKLHWVTDDTFTESRFHDWAIYTRAYYEHDKKTYGTQVGRQHRLDGDKVCVGSTYLAFQPLHLFVANKARAQERERRKLQSIARPPRGGPTAPTEVRLVERTAEGMTRTILDE